MLTEKDKIKHLYNRAGFGRSIQNLNVPEDYTAILDRLLDAPVRYTALESVTLAEVEAVKKEMKLMTNENVKDLKQQLKERVFGLNHLWFKEMINSESQLQEKMALFWHGHFACRSVNPYFDQLYLASIRKNALGNFTTLLGEISRSPAMLQFLNNQQNKKDKPNENFAREVMELFTLGRGNYTEQDIKEAARAFTGWGFDFTGQFKFRVQQHDSGVKTFQGKTGSFSGEDILQMITEKKECAYFITKKIYEFFVNDMADESIVQPLSEKFYQSGYDIKTLMKAMFSADWFYEEKNIGVKIKSPVELMAGMFRLIPVAFENPQSEVFIQRILGQILLNPPGVAGWKGGRSWIDSSSLFFRMRLPQIIYFDKEIDFEPKEELQEMGAQKMKMADDFIRKLAMDKLHATADWSGLISCFSASDNKPKDISETLLSRPVKAGVLTAVKKNSDNTGTEHEIKSIVINILSLPDYQLS